MECCATFAPEYHDTERDTAKALPVAAISGVIVYGLLPLGTSGTFGDPNITLDNYLGSFYADTFHDILGTGTGLAIILLCAGIVLAMNTATADGSRALSGISQDGMTIRWLGHLNRYHVPANAMTVDALLNIVLLLTYASDPIGALKILVFSNLGYVLCHVFATSGFVLLPTRPAELAASNQGVVDVGRDLLCPLRLRPDAPDLRCGQRRPRLRGEHQVDADSVEYLILGHRARPVRVPRGRPGQEAAADAAAGSDDAGGGEDAGRSHHDGLRLDTPIRGAGGEPARDRLAPRGGDRGPQLNSSPWAGSISAGCGQRTLAGATLVAVGALRRRSPWTLAERDEDGAILLAAGAALLALHVVLARREGGGSSDALLAAALAVPFIPAGVALLAYSPPSAASLFQSGGDVLSPFGTRPPRASSWRRWRLPAPMRSTRHPRWVLVVALAVGFGAELRVQHPSRVSSARRRTHGLPQSSSLRPRSRSASHGGCPGRLSAGTCWSQPLSCSPLRPRPGHSAEPPTPADLFLAGLLAAVVAIAWRRATPGSPSPSSSRRRPDDLALESLGLLGVAAGRPAPRSRAAATLWSVGRRTAAGRRRCRRRPPRDVR